jgi:hypothetical protein
MGGFKEETMSETLELLTNIEKIIIAVVSIIGTTVATFIAILRQFKKTDKRLADADQKLQEVIQYCCGNQKKEVILIRLNKIKNFFLPLFKDDAYRWIAGKKANAYIHVVENILDRYQLDDIDDYEKIVNEFEIGKVNIREDISQLMHTENIDKMHKKQDKLNTAFYQNLRKILLPTKNHHKERVVEAIGEHLTAIMENLLDFEKKGVGTISASSAIVGAGFTPAQSENVRADLCVCPSNLGEHTGSPLQNTNKETT